MGCESIEGEFEKPWGGLHKAPFSESPRGRHCSMDSIAIAELDILEHAERTPRSVCPERYRYPPRQRPLSMLSNSTSTSANSDLLASQDRTRPEYQCHSRSLRSSLSLSELPVGYMNPCSPPATYGSYMDGYYSYAPRSMTLCTPENKYQHRSTSHGSLYGFDSGTELSPLSPQLTDVETQVPHPPSIQEVFRLLAFKERHVLEAKQNLEDAIEELDAFKRQLTEAPPSPAWSRTFKLLILPLRTLLLGVHTVRCRVEPMAVRNREPQRTLVWTVKDNEYTDNLRENGDIIVCNSHNRDGKFLIVIRFVLDAVRGMFSIFPGNYEKLRYTARLIVVPEYVLPSRLLLKRLAREPPLASQSSEG